jgi:hypothetical protein
MKPRNRLFYDVVSFDIDTASGLVIEVTEIDTSVTTRRTCKIPITKEWGFFIWL